MELMDSLLVMCLDAGASEVALSDFDHLVQAAQIEIAVPTSPADSIEQGITNVLSGSQRRQLFQGDARYQNTAYYCSDEHITAYILLKFSKDVPIEHLEALKNYISLNMEVMLVDLQRQESSVQSKRDRIIEGPLIYSANPASNDIYLKDLYNLRCLAWREDLELVQSTGLNFHRVALVVTISSVQGDELSGKYPGEYMTEHNSGQSNVLLDTALREADLNLPVSRLTGSPFYPPPIPGYKPVRRAARRIFPLSPVISIKTTFAKPIPCKKTFLLTIEVEVYQSTAHKIELESVSLDSENAEASLLANTNILPLVLGPQDSLSLVYEISPSVHMSIEKQSYFNIQACPIVITTTARPLLPEHMRPRLVSKWKFLIDPTASSRPSTGEKSLTSKRSHSLQVPNISTLGGRAMARSSSTGISNGYTITRPFISPNILPRENTGQVFDIEVRVLNHSPSKRRISLLLDESNHKTLPPWPKSGNVVILDDTALDSLHRPLLLETAGLVSLMNDVHIGPIPAGACSSFPFKVKALKTGVATLDGLRIVDLGELENPQTTECRLPAVIIKE